MKIQGPATDMIRAMARNDWTTAESIMANLSDATWKNAVGVLGAAFALAVNDRFPQGRDLTAIAAFADEIRQQMVDGQTLSALQLEALMRATLGEEELIDDIDFETCLELQIVILGKLLHDQSLDEAQVEGFIRRVEDAADHVN